MTDRDAEPTRKKARLMRDVVSHRSRLAVIIDAWAQHPTLRHLRDPIFESLRR